eukprot:COSAG06_NODE_1107_length_10634_cov_44.531903_7_plen_126_part_00
MTTVRARRGAGIDEAFERSWWHGIPDCFDESSGGVHLPALCWIAMLYKSYAMKTFCSQRFNALADNTKRKSLGSWVPGYTLEAAPPALLAALDAAGGGEGGGGGAPYGPQVLELAREAQATFGRR